MIIFLLLISIFMQVFIFISWALSWSSIHTVKLWFLIRIWFSTGPEAEEYINTFKQHHWHLLSPVYRWRLKPSAHQYWTASSLLLKLFSNFERCKNGDECDKLFLFQDIICNVIDNLLISGKHPFRCDKCNKQSN